MLKIKKLLVIIGGCFGLFLFFAGWPLLAQTETFCQMGQSPQFQMGFAELKAQLGDPMGDPVECEHYDQQGNGYQQTTTGQAFFEKSSGKISFTPKDQTLAMNVTQQTTPTVVATTTQATTPPATTGTALAEMHDISGTLVGMAHFTETVDGIQMSLEISGLQAAAPGPHGIHFHQVGRCTPDFAVAGAHFNPTMAHHGLENPMGPHAGDLPNIEFGENGSATYITSSTLLSLTTGGAALLAADGTALMIHSKIDDQMSDPAGFSGGRIACGVLTSADVPPPAASGPPPPIQGNDIQPELRSATPDRTAQLQVPAGFEVSVFGEGLGSIRMMAQAEDGTIYVTRRGEGDVLALRDADGDAKADAPLVVASDLDSVHGIIINGSQIYLATPTTIYLGALAADGMVTDLSPLLSDMPEAGQHGNRTMAFGPDGLLYVSIGSPCNACGFDDEEYASIVQVQPDGSSRVVFADGLRNTIGWGWHPQTGQMWGMDHGSDWRGDDQPPEELNLLEQGNNFNPDQSGGSSD